MPFKYTEIKNSPLINWDRNGTIELTTKHMINYEDLNRPDFPWKIGMKYSGKLPYHVVESPKLQTVSVENIGHDDDEDDYRYTIVTCRYAGSLVKGTNGEEFEDSFTIGATMHASAYGFRWYPKDGQPDSEARYVGQTVTFPDPSISWQVTRVIPSTEIINYLQPMGKINRYPFIDPINGILYEPYTLLMQGVQNSQRKWNQERNGWDFVITMTIEFRKSGWLRIWKEAALKQDTSGIPLRQTNGQNVPTEGDDGKSQWGVPYYDAGGGKKIFLYRTIDFNPFFGLGRFPNQTEEYPNIKTWIDRWMAETGPGF